MAKSKIRKYYIPNHPRQENRIMDMIKQLKLTGMQKSIKKVVDDFLKSDMTPYDLIENLLEKEIVWKEDNRVQYWTKQAKFPLERTLQTFNFSTRNLNPRNIQELASCRFIENKDNIIFMGTSGVGKTHLAISLGKEAINKGYEVRFFKVGDLETKVDKLANDGAARKRLLATLTRCDLLILDEMALQLQASSTFRNFLFTLLTQRYERNSTIFTTNREFDEWGKLFNDNVEAIAAIERIIHKSAVFLIKGDSYRVKEQLEKQKEYQN